ncbi:hypothetical protein AB0M12_41120 [Nocardia vinacea]
MLELLTILVPLFGLILPLLLIPTAVEIAGRVRDKLQVKEP